MVTSATSVEVSYVGAPPHNKKQLETNLRELPDNTRADSAMAWLRAEGYLDAAVESVAAGLTITVGERSFLKRLFVVSDSSYGVTVDLPFTATAVEEAIEPLLMGFYDRGYFYARAKVISVERDGSDVTLRVECRPGPCVRVAGRMYDGLKRTRRKIISRYISLQEGDTLTESGLRAAEEEASGIPFVSFSGPLTVQPRPGFTEADVMFRFREKRQFSIFGGVGYVPDDPVGVVWDLDLKLINLFGDGRQIGVCSERPEKDRNLLDITYVQPLFVFGVGEMEIRANTRDYRDDFYEFGLRGDYRLRLRDSFSAGLGLGWRHVEPADNFSTDSVSSYSAYTIDFSVDRSAVDDVLNPSRGAEVSMTIGYTHRRYACTDSLFSGDGPVFNETRSKLALKVYHPLVGPLTGYLGLSFQGLETGQDLPPTSELILVGGPGTLRGYRNEQFAVQRTLLASFEPRLRFRQGYIFIFYDAAYLNRKLAAEDGTVTDEFFRDGTGFGLSLHDSARRVKLSLGWNDEVPFDQPRLSIELSSDL